MIRNASSGKVYIGSAVDLERRQRDHFRCLRGGYHSNRHLQAAFNSYGEAAFGFVVLASVPNAADLTAIEQTLIDEYRSADRDYGYNSRPRAESNLGLRLSQQTKAKLRAANLGKRQSAELIERRIAPLRGRPISEGHKRAIGAKNRGRQRADVARWAPELFAKYSPDIVRAMRSRRASGETYRAIAAEFGCSIGTAHFAVNGTGAFYSRVA